MQSKAPNVSHRVRAAALLAAAALAAAFGVLALGPSGGAAGAATERRAAPKHLYWANDTYQGTIGRAKLNGAGVDKKFITPGGQPCDVATNSKHIFWTSRNLAIGRANLDGSHVKPAFIQLPGEIPCGIAVNAEHIYWADPASDRIGRADLDGKNADLDFIDINEDTPCDGCTVQQGIAIDSGHVYWTNNLSIPMDGYEPAIGRADLNGSNIDTEFISVSEAYDDATASGVAVDSQHVYWTKLPIPLDPGSVGRAALDGSDPELEWIPVTGDVTPTPCGVDVAAGHAYWAWSSGAGNPAGLGRAGLDGSAVEQSFIKLQRGAHPCGVAVGR